MAKALYLITADKTLGDRSFNGVTAVLINSDDGGSDAQKRAEAVAAVQAGVCPDLPAGYFDNGRILNVGDLTSGALEDDTDAAIFHGAVPGFITLKQAD